MRARNATLNAAADERAALESVLFASSLRQFITGGALRNKDGTPHAALDGGIAGAWDIMEPGEPLLWGWYLDAICDFLEAWARGEITRASIEMPPRFLKSGVGSIALPAWLWTHEPRARWIGASYNRDLQIDHATKARTIMQHPWYRERWGHVFGFADDQNTKTQYRNTVMGERIAAGVDTGITGKGATHLVMDDPVKVQDAYNEAAHREASKFWFETMATRANHPKTVKKLVIMQRLHALDLAGEVRDKGYTVLSLPLEYDPAHQCVIPQLGWKDPRTTPGEYLMPERVGPEEVAEFRGEGSHAFNAQYNQRPTSSDVDAMFPEDDWHRYADLPRYPDGHPQVGQYVRPDEAFTVWDMTFKGKKEKGASAAKLDYVVGALWYRYGVWLYLIDLVRGQWGLTETCKQLTGMIDRAMEVHPFYPTRHVVEEKANGAAVMDALGNGQVSGFLPFNPDKHGDKVARAWAMQPSAESGDIRIPGARPWLHEPTPPKWLASWLEEHRQFPDGKHDDQVDTTSIAHLHTAIRRRNRPRIR